MIRRDVTSVAGSAGRDRDYEQLRRHAVEPGASERVHGLAVLAYRGLAAWLCTCVESTGDAAAPRQRPWPQPTQAVEMVQAS